MQRSSSLTICSSSLISERSRSTRSKRPFGPPPTRWPTERVLPHPQSGPPPRGPLSPCWILTLLDSHPAGFSPCWTLTLLDSLSQQDSRAHGATLPGRRTVASESDGLLL